MPSDKTWVDEENEIEWTLDPDSNSYIGEKVGVVYEPESGVFVIALDDGTAMTIRYD